MANSHKLIYERKCLPHERIAEVVKTAFFGRQTSLERGSFPDSEFSQLSEQRLRCVSLDSLSGS